MKRFAIFAALAVALPTTAPAASAAVPGWSNGVSPMSAEAQQIRSHSLLHRPNRPGHIYGNTLRRWHYRGNPLPTPGDFSGTRTVMFGR